MADPTTYHRIILKFQSPFTKRGETGQYWTLKFSLSGAALTSSADAEATASDLASDILGLVTPNTSWVGWRYYAAGSSVNEWGGDYAPSAHPGTEASYAESDRVTQQLEVVALLRCYVKQSSKGRPVYLFKHVHDIAQSGTAAGELAGTITNPLPHLNDGAGPNLLVPCDPTTGQTGTGWAPHTALYTRQLRKGVKPPI